MPKRWDRKRAVEPPDPALTVAAYYRMKLMGLLSSSQPSYEEYLEHAVRN